MNQGPRRLEDQPSGRHYPMDHQYSIKNDPDGSRLAAGRAERLEIVSGILSDRSFEIAEGSLGTASKVIEALNGTVDQQVQFLLDIFRTDILKTSEDVVRAFVMAELCRFEDFQDLDNRMITAEQLKEKNPFLYDALAAIMAKLNNEGD